MAEAFGLPVEDLPAGWVPLRVGAVIECLQDDGTVGLARRYSSDLPSWALLGMLEAAVAVETAGLVDCFIEEDDDDG